jgi:small GTP-binding protein
MTKLLLKYILIGNSGIGKSSLAWRYKFNEFREYFVSTVGVDVQTISYPMFSTKIEILLWDTAGQERFHSISSAFYRDSIAIFLCFDHTDRKSFEDIPKWMNMMIDQLPDYYQIILVGLKNDKKDNIQVTKLEAELFAKKHYMTFYSVSAKTGENVDKMMRNMTELIYTDYHQNRIPIKERLGGIRIQKEKSKKVRRYSCFGWL